MNKRLTLILTLALTLPLHAAHVVFVDNTAQPGGEGSVERPLQSIEQGLRMAEVVYVAETPKPYAENIVLRKGQMLAGSAYGLDSLRVDRKVELDASMPAREGAGPLFQGTISVNGDNLIAGMMIVPPPANVGVMGLDADGFLELRNVRFRTNAGAFALYLQRQHGPVTILGGALEGSDGNGITISGGEANVTFDRFSIGGVFRNAIRIGDRATGAVVFRNGSRIRIDDATDDAIALNALALKAPVTFEDRVEVRGQKRGLFVAVTGKLTLRAEGSTLASTGGAALELHDSGADLLLESVASTDAAEGVVVDKLRGRVEIHSAQITRAKRYGMRLVQSSNVHVTNATMTASGSAGVVKGAKCAGEFDVNTTAPCNAALYVRHLQQSSFEKIVVDGGGAMGVNANNIRDVTFTELEVRNAGDESFEAGVLLQELGGTIRFDRCRLFDNAGSEMRVEQRFNKGQLVLDHCELAAPQRPQVAPRLLDLRSSGASTLDVVLTNCSLHDNVGSAIDAVSTETSLLGIRSTELTAEHLGIGAVNVHARDSSRSVVSLRGSRIIAPAVRDQSFIELAVEGQSSACVDAVANAFTGTAGGVHLTGATIRVTSDTDVAVPAVAVRVPACE